MVAVLPGLWVGGLGASCAPDHPEGEIACSAAANTSCPSYLPVCEQRRGDGAAYCYRTQQGAARLALRIAEPDPSHPAQSAAARRAQAPASSSFRLIDQTIATENRQLLATGR
ncbi:MAG: hypothetical protein ABW321_16655 [Polyangiales bacterium]